MSHLARLSLRAPPHLPFVQGFPGIPADLSQHREAPSVQGTLEVRVGSIPVKARWVRVELRKFESLPPGFPAQATEEAWELVGSIQTLWQPKDGKEWDTVQTADFKFILPLPLSLPPSIDLPKGAGVRYELVAALCYRQKGGVFKKESAPVIKVTEPIRITKHDLHSVWPIYNIAENRTIKAANGQMELTVSRPCTGFSVGDKVRISTSLKSSRPKPFILRGFEYTLSEVITYIPPPPGPSSKSKKHKLSTAPVTKARPIQTVRAPLNENIVPGGAKSATIEMEVGNVLVTVKGAKTLEVEYDLEVKAIMEGVAEKVEMRGIRSVVGPFSRDHAQRAVKDIGYYEPLCPDIPGAEKPLPPRTSSIQHQLRTNGVPVSYIRPNQQPVIQGFTPRSHRRQSSLTSITTDTTTTATTATHEFGTGVGAGPGGNNSQRPFQTMPPIQRRTDIVAFPDPRPARPRSTEPEWPVESLMPERHAMSEAGHGADDWRRYSSGTAATFGRWDLGLQTSIMPMHNRTNSDLTQKSPTTPTKPSSSSPPVRKSPSSYTYVSAEQEKRRQQELYDNARARAAEVQKASGASLDRIGLGPSGSGSPGLLLGSSADGGADEEVDDVPPPEYAPPRPPAQGEYVAPIRPISTYTSRPSERAITSMSTPQSSSAAPPSSPSAFDKVYLSAGQEKEAQRRRYEEATTRVYAGSSSAAPSTRSKKQAVDGGPIHFATSPAPLATSTSSPAPSTSAPAEGQISSLSEKEQMKRYYEAQDRVARAAAQRQNGEGGVDGQAGSSGSPLGRDGRASLGVGNSIAAIGAIDEKEQMRRYDEAKERVAAAAASASGSGNRPSSVPVPVTRSVSTHVGLMDEKEQMRRYYEAQDRVAAAASGASGGGNVPSCTSTRHSALSSIPTTAHADVIDEKEQMRRYYEAEDRVARAAERRAGLASASASASGSVENDAPPPTFEASASSSSSGGSVGGANHLSAEEEKALMRQRYELAQTAVRKNTSPDPSGTSNSQPIPPARSKSSFVPGSKSAALPTSSSSEPSTPMPNGRPLSNVTAATMSTSSDSPNLRNPLVKAGKARTAHTGNKDVGYGYAGGSGIGRGGGNGGEGSSANVPAGPPPPLPTKPPREYIHLLSPVGE
ncbi:hypothetical protein I307_05715 [Cryptococcus deuterogattii 99/473]|uniref:Arrestin C-terminal-like domain-containing protein n=1 Tax=Cryptococcus deuterogattii Ram5 TaxID=1296110 RepID=A0A0D0V4Y6_9TREE|nr:hypothetical protein I313_02784 [Cryptococcus deuterogattii Ram5]KIY54954.1 hypothetical protein I307_05715 [Cryptococcus deuterogattii 99/473]